MENKMFPYGYGWQHAGFKFPPYQRHVPWRCDADYEMAIVSPVGIGPKGDNGEDLLWSNMSDEDKQNLADMIDHEFNKGDKGDTGDSAYEIAVAAGYAGTISEWLTDPINGIKGATGDFNQLSSTQKEELRDLITSEAIEDALEEVLPEIGAAIAENAINNIYPVGSLYMTMDDNFDPSVTFGGQWTKIEERFLLGTAAGESALDEDQQPKRGGADTITLTDANVPLRNHRHAATGLTFDHVHNEGKDTIVRPFQIRTSGHMQRQAKVGGSNVWITSFTRQSTPSAEGYNHNDGYDGRAIIFNHLRRNTDNASTAKASYVKTYGPIAPIGQDAAGNGTSKTGIDGNTSYTSLEATQAVNILPPYIKVHIWQRTSLASNAQETSNSSNDSETN